MSEACDFASESASSDPRLYLKNEMIYWWQHSYSSCSVFKKILDDLSCSLPSRPLCLETKFGTAYCSLTPQCLGGFLQKKTSISPIVKGFRKKLLLTILTRFFYHDLACCFKKTLPSDLRHDKNSACCLCVCLSETLGPCFWHNIASHDWKWNQIRW